MSYKTLLASIAPLEIVRLLNTSDTDPYDVRQLNSELRTRLSRDACNEAIFNGLGLEGYAKAFLYSNCLSWKGLLDKDFLQQKFDAALSALPVKNGMAVKTEEYIEEGYAYGGAHTALRVTSVKLTPVTTEMLEQLLVYIELAKTCDLSLETLATTVGTALKSAQDIYSGSYPKNHKAYDKSGSYGGKQDLESKTDEAVKAWTKNKPQMRKLVLQIGAAVEGLFTPDTEAKVTRPVRELKQEFTDKRAAELHKIHETILSATPKTPASAFKGIAPLVAKFDDDVLADSYELVKQNGAVAAFVSAVAEGLLPARLASLVQKLTL